MQEFLIGRQQITDRKQEIFAYELLFRDAQGRPPQHAEATEASNQVIVNSLLEEGLERLVGPHRAFINFTRENILNGTALLLPKDKVVIEVLETVKVDDALIENVKELSRQGYMIALDDFVFTREWLPLIKAAHIIKLDILAISPDVARAYIEKLGKLRIKFLAEKVETQEQFDDYLAMGCEYFQGYFFSRPKIVKGKRIGAGQHALIRLLAEINRSDIDIDTLAHIISTDAGLSYKLLRYINNSAFFHLPQKLDSISRAILCLGMNETKRWANLMALAGFPDTEPEIIMLALARAKMCELLALTARQKHVDNFFLTGLMSMLEKMMGVPLEEALTDLPLAEDVMAALLSRDGVMGECLNCAIEFEDWALERAKFRELALADVGQAYKDAVIWANEVMSSINAL
jgi:EAL and modified HD-GYP domain-containing signal transduction protein